MRVALDTSDPHTGAEAAALADAARAIVTSPGHIATAMENVGAQRDPAQLAQRLKLESLGSSGVLQLTVRDSDPRLAARLANVLASDLVQTRLTRGRQQDQRDELLANIDVRIRDVGARIQELDRRLSQVSSDADTAPAATSVLSSLRSSLAQEKLALEGQRLSALLAQTERPRPAIIDAATPPLRADPDRRLASTLLGAFVGLTAALIAACLMETFSPTISGSRTISRSLGVPLIGHISGPIEGRHIWTADGLARRLHLVASAAGVKHVKLLPAGAHRELGQIALALQRKAFAASGSLDGVRVSPFAVHAPSSNGARQATTAAVVVSPSKLTRARLEEIADILHITGWPLLGLITYDGRPHRPAPFSRRVGLWRARVQRI